MLRLASDNLPASESWLARFCSIIYDIERSKLTVDELCGLLLQATVKAPPGSNAKNFEYSISQPLDDMSQSPTFGNVTTIIQSALSKVSKGPTSVLSPGTIPSDIEMSTVNAINAHRNDYYEPPHRRNADQNNPQPSRTFSVEKAAFYRGKGHSDSLMKRFGYACLYCRETGHYSDCDQYWEDVRFGRVAAPPANHNDKGSHFVPPTRQPPAHVQPASQSSRQSNGRIRKIDVPEANDGTILLDSGSTINVSGTSKFFTVTSKLDCPLTISLAISSYMAPIEY
ncbi:uncharacterized protein VP01_5693g1, partial [Puccinia sorghi]